MFSSQSADGKVWERFRKVTFIGRPTSALTFFNAGQRLQEGMAEKCVCAWEDQRTRLESWRLRAFFFSFKFQLSNLYRQVSNNTVRFSVKNRYETR